MRRILALTIMALLICGMAQAAGLDFEKLDRDKSGTLEEREVLDGTAKAFKAYDRDGDGTLDLSEFEAAGGSVARFMSIDRNKDGSIDLKELSEATRKRFKEIDRDRDGRIDMPELKSRQAPIDNPLFIFHF
jgi:Ca2+-binding EF-hand superfamily protein